MSSKDIPELWEWAEYYCPWCYISAVRLQKILHEYQGQVSLHERAFPLEIFGGGPPDRKELELEMWLAALQEPEAKFKPFNGNDWPTTTLPAFEAAWSVFQMNEKTGHEFDLRIRQAFFAEGRNIGRREVMLDLAHEAGLDMADFTRLFNSDRARESVLEEGKLGKEHYNVRGTPTLMLEDGTKLRHPLAYANIQDGKILSVGRLPCCGESCYQAIRNFYAQALESSQKQRTPKL